MGNYLYDDYEAKMKVTNDVINDNNFYKKLQENFVSPKKIFVFVQIIFATFKCPPYHTKFLQVFYNNLNILERDEYFVIVEDLYKDLTANKLSFHESYNNFNVKLCDIKAKNPDRSIFNFGLVKPKKDAIEYFFLYVNFHKNEFENIKNKIKHIVKEVNNYPQKIGNDPLIQKIISDNVDNQTIEETYIGTIINGVKEGKGMLISKNKSNGQIISTYIGEFSNDKKNGFGLLKKEGEQIEGSFVEDQPDGKMGIFTADKKIYAEYKNGKKHGRYIELLSNGGIFTKEFKDDITTDTFSFFSVDGDFLTGKRIENDYIQGVLYFKEEGSVEVGTFDPNLNLTGEGYRYKNKDSIYCTFNDGIVVPSICYICEKDGRVSFGYCNENANFHGNDIITFLYTNDEFKGDLMIKDYNDGEEVGKREYYWGDGDYEKILANNWGIRAYKDGEKIMEGTFTGRGFPEGFGYFTYKDTKYKGEYHLNDKRCLFISNNRRAYSCGISNEARFNEATATQYKTEVNN